MARGGQGLTKVSLGPAMSYPSTPCGLATLETTLWSFQGWLARRAGSLRLSSAPVDNPHRTPMRVVEGWGGRRVRADEQGVALWSEICQSSGKRKSVEASRQGDLLVVVNKAYSVGSLEPHLTLNRYISNHRGEVVRPAFHGVSRDP
jgi:hypothetical protein